MKDFLGEILLRVRFEVLKAVCRNCSVIGTYEFTISSEKRAASIFRAATFYN